MSQKYYHLFPQGDTACTMEKSFFGTSDPAWLCTGCRVPRPEVQSVDVCIQERRFSPKIPLSFVFGYGVCIAHRDFLTALGEAVVAQDLWTGTVYNDVRQPFKEWVTIRGRDRVIVRGSTNVTHRVCTGCTRNVYYAGGSRYLYPAPSGEHRIYETDLRGLLIPTGQMPPGIRDRWPKLGVEMLVVPLNPADGLGPMSP